MFCVNVKFGVLFCCCVFMIELYYYFSNVSFVFYILFEEMGVLFMLC